MNQVAFILDHTTIYWYSIVLALAVMSGVCFFMACCQHAKISSLCAAGAVALSLALALLLSRLLYWYSRADSFENIRQALTTPASGSFALTGAFAGCTLAAVALKKWAGSLPKLLDCMSVAGCAALALGRLGNFFTSSDRGQIMTEITGLPWAYPVMNASSGMLEFRFATFMFQAIIAGVLFVVLAFLFFRQTKERGSHGDITMLFLMVYSASQILLDSTRYDSLYFRSNGFVSMVQVLCAVILGVSIILCAVRAVKSVGLKKWMVPVWCILGGLFGLAGFMEYYVQRHGRLALFGYCVMEHCLVGILVFGICFWKLSRKQEQTAA